MVYIYDSKRDMAHTHTIAWSRNWLGCSGIVEAADGCRLRPSHFNLVPKEVTNIADTVFDHGGTLQR